MIAHSIAFDGDIDLTHRLLQSGQPLARRSLRGGAHMQPGKDGRLRPVHDIGMPILFAPYYMLAYRVTEG